MLRPAFWMFVALLLFTPGFAWACAVCAGGAEDDVRKAFIATTAFLTFCPLLMIGTFAWWFRRRLQAMDEAPTHGA